MSEPALKLDAVARHFPQAGREDLHVLTGANLEIRAGEIIALVAPSGAGKSTLLHVAGLLDRPDGGRVLIGGRDAGALPERDRTAIRRTEIGFVYQFHHLLPEFTAVENVALPQLAAGKSRAEADAEAERLLALMGLAERADHRPSELSGGEQQRVAICRAVANAPRLLLADEPTGNLDPATSDRVFDALLALVRGEGLAALIATHNMELAARMDRVVRLSDGRISGA
jgi:lipoprotein-releasing system ATP-binding protein